MAYSTRASIALGCVLLLSSAVESQAQAVSCTATAGLDKRETATTSTGTERTGPYDVSLSAGSGGNALVTVAVRAKKDIRTSGATKVAAPIDTVLLRSPFKSEAIAQPTAFTAGAEATEGTATFEPSAVALLPKGDVDVIVVTADGERLCRITGKERQRLVAASR